MVGGSKQLVQGERLVKGAGRESEWQSVSKQPFFLSRKKGLNQAVTRPLSTH